MANPQDLDTPALRAELARMRQEELDLIEGKLDPETGKRVVSQEDREHIQELQSKIRRFTLAFLERSAERK